MVAKTISGLEEVLKKELEELGAQKTQVLKRAVSFEGDMQLMYLVNYCSRLALRILKPIHTFQVKLQEDLYTGISGIPWEQYLDSSKTFAIDAVIADSVFTNSQFVALRSKDGIADRLRKLWNVRPFVNLDDPDLRINVHLYKTDCTVSLDSSGQSLHKRGYRQRSGLAPLNEVLAAGLIRLAGWDMKTAFYDPMCGSGTLLIEAAMMASGIPAGYYRKDFNFMKWKDYDAGAWLSVKEKSDQLISSVNVPVVGSDILQKAVDTATENIRYARLQDRIKINVSSFEESKPPSENGIIVTNPPYDERMQMDDIISFYKMIGDVLKKKYTGYQAWVISSDIRALKFIGLHPSRKIPVFNGPLECRLFGFKLY